SCTAVPSTPGCVLFDETNLETDEMTWALSWFNQNLSGLSNLIYVMPGTYGDALTENIASSLGFKGVHHAWGRTYKDAFQRYHAMNGCEMRYQNGFDCQGLWVEVEVEKELQ